MNKNDSLQKIIICNWCGTPAKIIWVHGHGQCSNCGINVEECCKGETCNTNNFDPDGDKTSENKF